MQPIPLIRQSAIVPAIAILDEIGAPTRTLLRANRLPVCQCEHPAGFVSTLDVWAFIDQAADSQGLWDFGFRVAERLGVENAQRWGPRVVAAPTLQAAIRTMSQRIGDDMPNVRVGLERRRDGIWLWRDHKPDNRRHRGYWVGDQYMIAFMIQLVRLTVGKDWYPARLEIQASSRDWKDQRPEITGDAAIEFGMPRTSMKLPAGSLGRRLNGSARSCGLETHTNDLELPAANLSLSLGQALKSLAGHEALSLALGSEVLRTSERSLRRYLASEGTTWRELIDQVHLASALDLMDDSANSLADVAAHLGYSQYPHFYRAFVRWTGQGPNTYRASSAAA